MLKLSEAIRLGAAMRLRQAHGVFYDERRRWFGRFGPFVAGSCVMGAAFEGAGCIIEPLNPEHHIGQTIRPELSGPPLYTNVPQAWLPVFHVTASCPVCSIRELGLWLLTHLNDTHRWTREEIASFVEHIEAQESVDEPVTFTFRRHDEEAEA